MYFFSFILSCTLLPVFFTWTAVFVFLVCSWLINTRGILQYACCDRVLSRSYFPSKQYLYNRSFSFAGHPPPGRSQIKFCQFISTCSLLDLFSHEVKTFWPSQEAPPQRFSTLTSTECPLKPWPDGVWISGHRVNCFALCARQVANVLHALSPPYVLISLISLYRKKKNIAFRSTFLKKVCVLPPCSNISVL